MAVRGRTRSIRGHRPRPLPPDVLDLEDDDLDAGADERLEARRRQPPSLGSSTRLAASDVYYNSWRLAPANLIWGAVLIVALVAGPMSLLGLVTLVVLAVPTAGIHAMTSRIARGEPAGFSDFLEGMRRFAGPALLAGAGALGLIVVLVTNVAVGLQTGNPIGWFIGAMALWGLVGLAMLLVAFWPVLADPRRADVPVRRRLWLAGVAVIGRPIRMLALAVFVALFLAAATFLFAVVAVIGVAFVSMVASRHVLPTVDELEARLRH